MRAEEAPGYKRKEWLVEERKNHCPSAGEEERFSLAGVDGCPGGWLAAIAAAEEPEQVVVEKVSRLKELLLRLPRLRIIMIDIPIGLPENRGRECDLLARARLGPRRASVFPAPVRAVLPSRSYEEAQTISRQIQGRGLSWQSYYLLPRIREVDALLAEEPALQERIFETHPEVIFWALNAGRALGWSKKEKEGRELRLRLLASFFPSLERELQHTPGHLHADLIDAAACLAAALQFSRGCFRSFPDIPGRDRLGRRMEIIYPLPFTAGEEVD